MEMYLMVRKDGTAMLLLQIEKSSNLLNNVASTVKGFTTFMDIMDACMASSDH